MSLPEILSPPTNAEVLAHEAARREEADRAHRGRAARPSPFAPRPPAPASSLGDVLVELVERHGHAAVARALADLAAPKQPARRKSAEHAATYEGRLMHETERAILWWIPRADDPAELDGQAAWVPRVLVIEAADQRPADPLAPRRGPLGVLRTTKPIEWRWARRTGASRVEFTDRRPGA